MAEKNLIPELRFPGFEEEWVEKRLEEYFFLISGQHLNPDEYSNSKSDKNIPYFTGPSDFTNTKEKLTKWTLKVGKIATPRDILITVKGSGVGSFFYLELEKVAIGRQLMAIKSKNGSTAFLSHKLQDYKNYYVALASGNMIPGLSRSDILKTKAFFPTLSEQQKIASFLTAVDQRIQLLQKKKVKLEEYKKGVMQKLFSHEIRFKDENTTNFPDWEEKRLGEVCEINPSNGELPERFIYIDLESVNAGRLEKINEINRSKAPSRAQRILQYGDILFQTVRPYQRNNYRFKLGGNYVASTGYAQLRNESCPEYYFQYLHTDKFVDEVLSRCTGTSYPAINSNDLEKIKLTVPHPAEQQKIASFLSSLDQKVEQVKIQIEKMQIWKKGLLQKMFV